MILPWFVVKMKNKGRLTRKDNVDKSDREVLSQEAKIIFSN
jgi:hypothetical protein